MSTPVSYTSPYPGGWHNVPQTDTPMTAAALQDMDTTIGLVVARANWGANQATPGNATTRQPLLSFDIAANWAAANPVLNLDELAISTDTGDMRRGDGTSHWASLPVLFASDYAPVPAVAATTLNQLLGHDAGQANGVRWFSVQETAARAFGWVITTDARWSGGADPTGTADSTAAINAAIAQAQTAGQTLYFPDGTYLINTSGTGGASVLLPLTSGITIRGAGREKVTIKLGSGVTQWYSIIGTTSSTTDLTGLDIRGITFDCNSASNGWTSGTVGQRTSGYPRYVVSAYLGSRMVFNDNRVTNFDGSNCVVFNTGAGATAGTDMSVQNNLFDNIGTNTVYHDHSTIYVDALRSTIAHNTCVGVNVVGSNAICALEIHGGDQHVHHNKVAYYSVGGNVVTQVSGKATGASRFLWDHNDFANVGSMIQPWLLTAATDLVLEYNTGTIDPDRWSASPAGVSRFCMISGSQMSNPLTRLTVRGNQCVYLPSSSTTFNSTDMGLYLVPGSVPGSADQDWVIEDNHLENVPGSGVYIASFAGIARLALRRNTFRNVGTALLGAQYQTCVTVAGSAGQTIDDFTFSDNAVIDTQGTHSLHSAVFIAAGTVMSSTPRIVDNRWRIADGSLVPYILYNLSTSATPFVRHAQYGAAAISGQIAAGSLNLDESTGYTRALQNNTLNYAARLNLTAGTSSFPTLIVNAGATTSVPAMQVKDIAGNLVLEAPNDQSGLRRLGFTVTAWRGTWAATTVYYPGDLLTYNNLLYEVTTGFTSGSTFATTNLNQLTFATANPQPADNGYLGWNFDQVDAGGAGVALTSQTLYVQRVKVPAGGALSKVTYDLSAAASGATSGQCFAAIFDTSGNQLGVTNDLSGSLGSTGVVDFALASPTAAVAPGSIVLTALLIGATTPPSLGRKASGIAPNTNLTPANYRWASAGSSLTAMPASLTPSSFAGQTTMYWVAVK